jgi:PilZ domain-containing protein
MDAKKRRSSRVKISLPIRVRGMSSQNKYFDEEAETTTVSEHGLLARLRNLPELEAELHVTALASNVGGTFRVAWVNTLGRDGLHDVGLEAIQTDGNLCKIHFPPASEESEPTAPARLKCRGCQGVAQVPLPEAQYEFLCAGFLVARYCERCKATTGWEFTSEDEVATPSADEVAATPASGPLQERRAKRRARLRMQIKVMRKKYGSILEDVCETQNLSRHGAYFLTSRSYEVGEMVQAILPYKEGDELQIPVSARVVRVEEPKGTNLRGVAIRMDDTK